jgi:hypothetical protein
VSDQAAPRLSLAEDVAFLPPVRRVVTGHDEQGRSIIVSDGPTPHSNAPDSVPDLVARVVWMTDAMPVSNAGNEDAAPDGFVPPIGPPANGTIFRVADFPPDSRYDGIDIAQMFREIGGADAHEAGQDGDEDPRHFWFHKTRTIDYAVVLEGEIWAMMDIGECLLRPGDVVVQRGTNHAWSNRSDRPCRMAFVLIDALPDA